MKKTTKNILIVLMAFLSILAMTLNLNNVETAKGSVIDKGIIKINKSISDLDINDMFMFIFILYFYYKNYFKSEKTNKGIIFLAIFFSLALLFGESFYKTNSWDLILKGKIQIFKSIIKIFGYYFMIYILIDKLFDGIKYLAQKDYFKQNKIISFIFDQHPNICITLIILIVWLPFIILFYPSVLVSDAGRQINQLLGEYETVHIKLINPNVTLNNHHPLLSTLIIGFFIGIGKLINNIDVGIYLYTLFQVSVLIYVILYSFRIMKKMDIHKVYRMIALIFYSFCPIICIFGLTLDKDILFSSCIFYYVLLLIEMLIDTQVLEKRTYLIKMSILFLLIMLFRNNGIYTILLSFPFIVIWIKRYRKRLIACLIVPILIYFVLNKIVYPTIGISPGSVKEALSIPFQQTARTLYEGEFYEDEDIEVINKILNVDIISKKYNPILSDPVKNTFNKDYTTDMLLDYFKVWFEYLFRYPGTYIEATLNNSYGYLYPNKTDRVGYFKTADWFLEENPLNMKDLELFQEERNTLSKINKLFFKVPIIGNLLTPGFYNWLLLILFLFAILSKNKKFIVIYFALGSILLVCIASPYLAMRYMLSIVYSMPILLALSIYISKDNEQNEKEDLVNSKAIDDKMKEI